MALESDSFFDLYPQFHLDSFLIENNLEWRVADSGDHTEYSINCPKCVERGEPTNDVHKKLWINAKTAAFHCYRCKWSGSLISLVQEICRISLEQAVKLLKGKLIDPMDYMNLRLVHPTYASDTLELDMLRDVELPFGYTPIDSPHPYLKKRGIPWRLAAELDWGICVAGYCVNRLIVPTFMNSRLVFWQARATWEEPSNKDFKKVLNPKGVSSKPILYNFDAAKSHREVVLCEGFIDAVKCGNNAMATNGKRLSTEQCEMLAEVGVKSATLAWDADAWTDGRGSKSCSMRKASDLLRSYGISAKCAKFLPKLDAGSYSIGSPELAAILSSAVSL